MNEKYIKWHKMAEELKELKKAEQILRRELCDELFDGKHGEFTVSRDTDNFSVTAKSRVTRSIDELVLDTIEAELSPQEQACIKRKASLVLAPYRKLPETSILKEAITEKPAMPSLSITFSAPDL